MQIRVVNVRLAEAARAVRKPKGLGVRSTSFVIGAAERLCELGSRKSHALTLVRAQQVTGSN
jgi:hypothetical protein